MKKYFIRRNGICEGPYSLPELRIKTIQPTDFIWTQGILGWHIANSIKEFKILFAISRLIHNPQG